MGIGESSKALTQTDTAGLTWLIHHSSLGLHAQSFGEGGGKGSDRVCSCQTSDGKGGMVGNHRCSCPVPLLEAERNVARRHDVDEALYLAVRGEVLAQGPRAWQVLHEWGRFALRDDSTEKGGRGSAVGSSEQADKLDFKRRFALRGVAEEQTELRERRVLTTGAGEPPRYRREVRLERVRGATMDESLALFSKEGLGEYAPLWALSPSARARGFDIAFAAKIADPRGLDGLKIVYNGILLLGEVHGWSGSTCAFKLLELLADPMWCFEHRDVFSLSPAEIEAGTWEAITRAAGCIRKAKPGAKQGRGARDYPFLVAVRAELREHLRDATALFRSIRERHQDGKRSARLAKNEALALEKATFARVLREKAEKKRAARQSAAMRAAVEAVGELAARAS